MSHDPGIMIEEASDLSAGRFAMSTRRFVAGDVIGLMRGALMDDACTCIQDEIHSMSRHDMCLRPSDYRIQLDAPNLRSEGSMFIIPCFDRNSGLAQSYKIQEDQRYSQALFYMQEPESHHSANVLFLPGMSEVRINHWRNKFVTVCVACIAAVSIDAGVPLTVHYGESYCDRNYKVGAPAPDIELAEVNRNYLLPSTCNSGIAGAVRLPDVDLTRQEIPWWFVRTAFVQEKGSLRIKARQGLFDDELGIDRHYVPETQEKFVHECTLDAMRFSSLLDLDADHHMVADMISV